MRSTTHAALEAILNIIPLNLHLKGLVAKNSSRLMSLDLYSVGMNMRHMEIVNNSISSQESLRSSSRYWEVKQELIA